MVNKKSQSELISTVILILISIAAAGLILSFVVPYIKNKLAGSDCTDIYGKVEIRESGYTCYDVVQQKMLVQVHVNDISDKLSGLVIEVGGASSKSYTVTNGSDITSELSMYEGTKTKLEIPANTEERTYKILTSRPASVKLYPKLKNGQTCDASSVINTIESCSL